MIAMLSADSRLPPAIQPRAQSDRAGLRQASVWCTRPPSEPTTQLATHRILAQHLQPNRMAQLPAQRRIRIKM